MMGIMPTLAAVQLGTLRALKPRSASILWQDRECSSRWPIGGRDWNDVITVRREADRTNSGMVSPREGNKHSP